MDDAFTLCDACCAEINKRMRETGVAAIRTAAATLEAENKKLRDALLVAKYELEDDYDIDPLDRKMALSVINKALAEADKESRHDK